MGAYRPPARRLGALLGSGVALGVAAIAFAHAPLEEELAALTRAIDREPSVTLLCRRGELELLAGRAPLGRADFDRAAALDPTRPEPWLCRAKLALAEHDPAASLAAARAARVRCEDCVSSLFAEARALDASQNGAAALAVFDRALSAEEQPRPEEWLERSGIAARGVGAEEALRGLGAAIRRAGDLLPLHLAALDLEIRGRRFDDALRRLDLLERISPDRAAVLTRRADVLRDADRQLDALAEYTRALEEIERLGPDRRATKNVAQLEAHVRARLRESP